MIITIITTTIPVITTITTLTMSATTPQSVIFEKDSLTESQVVKHDAAELELIAALPQLEKETQSKKVPAPFEIHSDVLDSIFSTNLDGTNDIDHTPMFDELDFILDGAKVNSKEDWVALFEEGELESGAGAFVSGAGEDPILALDGAEDDDALVPREESLEGLLLEASPNGLSSNDETISAPTTNASSSASSPELCGGAASTIATSVTSLNFLLPEVTDVAKWKNRLLLVVLIYLNNNLNCLHQIHPQLYQLQCWMPNLERNQKLII